MDISGFDPLCAQVEIAASPETKTYLDCVMNEAAKATIVNILKSYTGFYDLFSEALQNALDATQKKTKLAGEAYQPRIWIDIDLRDRGSVRIADNGIGMNKEEFLLCYRPNVSYKREDNLRGNKGVGATFLAYGYNYISLQTKQSGDQYAAILRGGRQWAEDRTAKIPRPLLEEQVFDIPYLEQESSGTSIEISLTGGEGEKPKDLGWQNATTANQWLDILRIVTPLGGTYLRTPPYKPNVRIHTTDRTGNETIIESEGVEYYYPHEIPGLKAVDLKELRNKLQSIAGDPQTQSQKLPGKYKNLECIFDIWTTDEILASDSVISTSSLTEEQKTLMQKHQVTIYGAFMDSVKTFEAFNKNLNLRENAHVMNPGLQLASDFMPQGNVILIPLKRFTGYQFNTLIIVHFTQGNPDLGRKTFQPELHELAEQLAVDTTRTFIKYKWLMKPDTGAVKSLTPSKELYDWKKLQERWRDQNPLSLGGIIPHIAYFSMPREEQDVISLYHELIGAGIIKGIRFFGTTRSDHYDALIELNYSSKEDLFEQIKNPLGVRQDLELPYESEPKVLEYKYDLDSLIVEFDKEEKFPEHIDLVVCWKASGDYSKKVMLTSFLIENEGNSRIFYGSTHNAYFLGQYVKPIFEVIILEDLCNYLLNSGDEIARQKVIYKIT